MTRNPPSRLMIVDIEPTIMIDEIWPRTHHHDWWNGDWWHRTHHHGVQDVLHDEAHGSRRSRAPDDHYDYDHDDTTHECPILHFWWMCPLYIHLWFYDQSCSYSELAFSEWPTQYFISPSFVILSFLFRQIPWSCALLISRSSHITFRLLNTWSGNIKYLYIITGSFPKCFNLFWKIQDLNLQSRAVNGIFVWAQIEIMCSLDVSRKLSNLIRKKTHKIMTFVW